MSSSQPISVATIMIHTIPKDITDTRSFSGFDERYFPNDPSIEKKDAEFQSRLQLQIYQMHWLHILQEPHISIHEKKDIVKQMEMMSSSYIVNLLAGGLMKDFDDDIF